MQKLLWKICVFVSYIVQGSLTIRWLGDLTHCWHLPALVYSCGSVYFFFLAVITTYTYICLCDCLSISPTSCELHPWQTTNIQYLFVEKLGTSHLLFLNLSFPVRKVEVLMAPASLMSVRITGDTVCAAGGIAWCLVDAGLSIFSLTPFLGPAVKGGTWSSGHTYLL